MAKLTTKQRNSLPSKSFAIPNKRSFPSEDRQHAINALARVSQFGSPEEKAKVRKEVYAKYPDLKKK